jgi:hypothetical protein
MWSVDVCCGREWGGIFWERRAEGHTPLEFGPGGRAARPSRDTTISPSSCIFQMPAFCTGSDVGISLAPCCYLGGLFFLFFFASMM